MFESVIEFANALAEGRRFKTPSGCTMFFDEKSNSPFRIGNISLDDAWSLYDVVTEIKRVIDWTKVPRNTLVEVRDFDNKLFVTRRFVTHLPNGKHNCFATYPTPEDERNASSIDRWVECRLRDCDEVPEEWYKYE